MATARCEIEEATPAQAAPYGYNMPQQNLEQVTVTYELR
jgi:hypothetical protein